MGCLKRIRKEDQMTVTPSRAAEIVGIEYEELRGLLERGLGMNAGVLPPFSGPMAPAEVLYAKRWTWKSFGPGDLGMFRLVKVLIDYGCVFADANSIASREEFWRYFSGTDAEEQWLAYYPDNTWSLYDSRDELDAVLKPYGRPAVVIELAEMHRYVWADLNKATPRLLKIESTQPYR
jgi:hypothetical protein